MAENLCEKPGVRFYSYYLRWGGFPQLKELDDEESRRRYIKEVVVEKILRYDLPARFGGENPIIYLRIPGLYDNLRAFIKKTKIITYHNEWRKNAIHFT